MTRTEFVQQAVLATLPFYLASRRSSTTGAIDAEQAQNKAIRDAKALADKLGLFEIVYDTATGQLVEVRPTE